MFPEMSEDSFRTFKGVKVADAEQNSWLGGGGPGTRPGGWANANVLGESSTHLCPPGADDTVRLPWSQVLSGWLFKVVLQKLPSTKRFAESTVDRMGLGPQTHRQVALAK